MKKFFIVLSSLIAAGLLFAAPMDNFKAGGWEFGGNAMYAFIPDYASFSSKTTTLDREDYSHYLNVEAKAGFFPADRFSLNVAPSLIWMQNHSDDDNYRNTLSLSLGLGCAYYFSLGGSLALSTAGELGLGMIPGIDGKSSGATDPNDSLDAFFFVKPNLGLYFFATDHLAPFIQVGYHIQYRMRIKNNDGSSYDPPSDHEFFDDVHTQTRVTIGLKFFFPAGEGRFSDSPAATYPDLIGKAGS